jgi:C4-type Zn-finger protein
MSLEIVPKPPKDPKCPSCEHSPLNFAQNTLVTGMGALVSVCWCGDCGYTLAVQFVGQKPPEVARVALVRPS